MVRRFIPLALVACSGLSSGVRAQVSQPPGTSTANTIAYAAPWVAYGVLSIGAIATLMTLPSEAPADSGRLVRVRVAGGGYQMGRVVGYDARGMTIARESGGAIVASPDDVEVSLGHRGRWAQGWGIGFLGGAGTGAVIGFASGDDPPGTFLGFTAGQKALIAGGALAIVGSTVGTLIGLAAPDRWVQATRPDAASRVSVSPIVGSRLGLSAKVTF